MVAPESPIKLTDILSADVCLPKLEAADRWQAMDAMLDLLVRTGKLNADDLSAVSKAVRDRERTKSTGIGSGVALPHASVACVTDILAVVARLEPPIDFLAPDGEPISLCVLFLSPQGRFQKHLHTLSAFARVLSSRDHRLRLQTAQTSDEMLAVFRLAN
jgi:mannitol/fructose-specific phosphotransferase system IIA component (Ntr-type)